MKKESLIDQYIKRTEFEALKLDEQNKEKRIVLNDDTFFYGLQIEQLIKSINGLSTVMRDKR